MKHTLDFFLINLRLDGRPWMLAFLAVLAHTVLNVISSPRGIGWHGEVMQLPAIVGQPEDRVGLLHYAIHQISTQCSQVTPTHWSESPVVEFRKCTPQSFAYPIDFVILHWVAILLLKVREFTMVAKLCLVWIEPCKIFRFVPEFDVGMCIRVRPISSWWWNEGRVKLEGICIMKLYSACKQLETRPNYFMNAKSVIYI